MSYGYMIRVLLLIVAWLNYGQRSRLLPLAYLVGLVNIVSQIQTIVSIMN